MSITDRPAPPETHLRMIGDDAEFIVVTAEPLYRERLVHMGWTPSDGHALVRRVAAPNNIGRIHANFARHLEAMVRQSARLDPVPWERALSEFLARVQGTGLRWWLYGSGALAVRGIAVSPGDLDFAVDDPHLVADLLDDLLVEPVTYMPLWVARWAGSAFAGAIVEWLAEPDPAFEPHEQGLAAARRLDVVPWQGWDVPVPPLDLQLEVALRRGLVDTAAKIRASLDGRPM